jgi:hypothetical protein
MSRHRSVDNLAVIAILAMVGIALAHGWAAQVHYTEAAEHAEMGGMEAEVASLTTIARALVVSAIAGLVVAGWGIVVRQRRRGLAAWTAVSIVGYSAMVAAGIASRTSYGLAGHTDDAGPLWTITVAAEVLVLILVAAYAAAQTTETAEAIASEPLGVVGSRQ